VFHPTLSIVLMTYRHSDNSRLLFWCAVGFCAGIYLFIHGFRLLGRRRLILDTPVSKIRSASMGMVEISGLAVGPYTMIAPITARPCYYFRTIVWEWETKGQEQGVGQSRGRMHARAVLCRRQHRAHDGRSARS
jgi:hypothetical protein